MTVTMEETLEAVRNDPKIKEACFDMGFKAGYFGGAARTYARRQFESDLVNNTVRCNVTISKFMPYYSKYVGRRTKGKKAIATGAVSLATIILSCFVRDADTSALMALAGTAGLVPSAALGAYYHLRKI